MAWHREESQVRADLSQNARKKMELEWRVKSEWSDDSLGRRLITLVMRRWEFSKSSCAGGNAGPKDKDPPLLSHPTCENETCYAPRVRRRGSAYQLRNINASVN
ncbi:hypothetical protein QC760_009297 [Botrytis cinerea]